VGFPDRLRPPLSRTLARGVKAIPAAGALPGGCLYEPKWDGYRLAVLRDEESVTLWSRQGKDLTRYFPDLAAAAEEQIPPGCIVDGETIIWVDDRLDFTSLQSRQTTSRKNLSVLVRERPASFAAFDLLAVAGNYIRDLSLSGPADIVRGASVRVDTAAKSVPGHYGPRRRPLPGSKPCLPPG
jgi:ATP-dependent DNA ligase